MTIRQIIQTLISQGHSITYYERKDGGVLIRSIDGQRFVGAKGNIVARSLLNQTLSEKRTKQLVEAKRTRKSLAKYKELTDLKSEWRRVRELWRKAFPSSKRHKSPIGQFTWKRIRWAYINLGKEEALRRIAEAERYAQGLAYNENIDILISRLQDYMDMISNPKDKQLIRDLIKDIQLKRDSIKEKSIAPTYETLYKLNQGASVQEVVREVRKILEL